ncbi:sulfoxide reductase heme-binding subunit YedZ, partial [Lysobacter sp. 2RAB21]
MIAAKVVVHALALTPAAILAWQIREEFLTGSGGLGADPIAAIEHRLGLWALRLLLIALAVTPLRQLTGQAVLLRFRRLLGLYAFFYAS